MIPMMRIPFLNKLNKRKTVSVVRLNGLIASGARGGISDLSLIHISEPTRQAEISYAVYGL